MNILFVITNLNIGGAEKYVVNLSNSLVKEKHEVTICVLEKGGVLKAYLNSGVKMYELGSDSGITIKKIMRLKKIIKENDFQLIHSHLFKGDLVNYLSSFGEKKGVVRVSTEHSSSSRRKRYKLFGYLQKIMYKRFDVVTAISDDVRSHILKWTRISSEKVITIYNGTDIEVKATKEIINKVKDNSKRELIIGSLSRLEKRKNLETALKGIHHLVYNMNTKNIKYLIYGDGPEKENLVYIAESLNITKYVVFAGFHSNVIEIIDDLDLHILTSKEEGFGISIIETMARGIPNIATRTGGIPEVLRDNIDGFLVECEDYKELATKINFFAEDFEKLIDFGVEAKNRVNQCYTLKENMFNTLKVYKSISSLVE